MADSPIPALEDIALRLNGPISADPPDMIPGFLPKHGEMLLVGATDVGKSLICLEVCSSLLTGRPLWGELEPVKQAKKILYILGEHYIGVIQRLLAHTKLPMPDTGLILGPEQLSYDKWLVANGKPNLQAIEKFMKWSEGVDLICFDPLGAFVSGVDVENDNITMRLVIDTMNMIAQSVGASCMVLAHQGKPMMDKFGSEHSRKSYATRGASGIEDAATNIFYVSQAESNSAAANRLPGDALILNVTKRKYKGQAPNEYKLMRDPTTLTHSLLGNRPFVEVQRIATQAKIARMQGAFPDMKLKDIIRAVATMQDLSPDTVRRYLGMECERPTAP